MEKSRFWMLITALSLLCVAAAFLGSVYYYNQLAEAYQQLAECEARATLSIFS